MKAPDGEPGCAHSGWTMDLMSPAQTECRQP